MKSTFSILLIFSFCCCFGQNKLYPFPLPDTKELKFSSVENSKFEITKEQLKDFKVIDTIANPYSFLVSDNFSVSIAIATSNGYDVYKLSELSQNNRRTLEEIGDPRNQCSGYLQILDRQHIGLDKSGNKELILKFLKNTYCCPTCAIPLNYRSYEGYVIFDFDKLIMLELTTRSSMFVTSDGVPASERVAKFEKNYLRVGKRKYYYRNGALVRK